MGWNRTGSLRPCYAAQTTTAADGTFSLALPSGMFAAPPIPGAVALAADGRDYVVTLTSVTATTIAGQVRKSRTLPAVVGALAVLANYDTFIPAPGATVYVTAQRAT